MAAVRVVAAASALLFLAACGADYSTSAGSSPAGSSPAAAVKVDTASKSVGGASRTVLVDSRGMTLYWLSSESAAHVLCTGGCAGLWPPVLSGSNQAPGGSLPGKLSVASGPNGNQVSYNGHPLYAFANDKSASDVKGEGIKALGGTWHAATPDVAPAAGATGSSPAPAQSPESSPSGYGGYGGY